MRLLLPHLPLHLLPPPARQLRLREIPRYRRLIPVRRLQPFRPFPSPDRHQRYYLRRPLLLRLPLLPLPAHHPLRLPVALPVDSGRRVLVS